MKSHHMWCASSPTGAACWSSRGDGDATGRQRAWRERECVRVYGDGVRRDGVWRVGAGGGVAAALGVRRWRDVAVFAGLVAGLAGRVGVAAMALDSLLGVADTRRGDDVPGGFVSATGAAASAFRVWSMTRRGGLPSGMWAPQTC